MTFVFPFYYKGSFWKNSELRYCLRSLEKFYSGNIEIVIFGDKKPAWLQNVNFKQTKRFYPPEILKRNDGIAEYENFFDVLNKLKLASEDKDVPENFVWTYDDTCLLRSLDHRFFDKKIASNLEDDQTFSKNRDSKHGKTINKAINLVNHIPSAKAQTKYSYETHLPRMFKKSKLKDMFTIFPFHAYKIPYAPSTLYYNLYEIFPDIVLEKRNDIRAGFYGNPTDKFQYDTRSIEEIEEAVFAKNWLSYNNSGLNKIMPDAKGPFLKQFIQKKYPQKSKYEK